MQIDIQKVKGVLINRKSYVKCRTTKSRPGSSLQLRSNKPKYTAAHKQIVKNSSGVEDRTQRARAAAHTSL
jgi:hypothetical protein